MKKLFYKKIAILTDNTYMADKFLEILNKYIELVEYKFFISPFSDISQFGINGIEIIDVKNESHMDFLIQNFDLILSMHSKQLFPKELVNSVKCINVHPGYNPINRGWYPQVFAIINNTDIGATIHEIDEKLDHGNIIDRKKVEEYSYDTSLTLYNRIVETEIDLLEKNIDKILSNNYSTIIPEKDGVLYLKKDFNLLKEMDLNKTSTYGKVINHLRALSHGDYKNAFFIDNNGDKVFIKISLAKESTIK